MSVCEISFLAQFANLCCFVFFVLFRAQHKCNAMVQIIYDFFSLSFDSYLIDKD